LHEIRSSGFRRQYVAHSQIAIEGRVLAARALGPTPSRYSAPLNLATARAEMDLLNHRFLYFTDAADGRARVLYLRLDGDYGLVRPW
jgi:Sigma 54 modulation/S30EA ribosomal protein C terminus